MYKLISIELKKIFHKKSVFIIMIIILLFNLLNNFLFFKDYDSNGNYKYLENKTIENEKRIIKEDLKKYNYNNINDLSLYIGLKTKLDIINVKEQYPSNSWQYNKANDYLYQLFETINIHTYQTKDEILLNQTKKALDESLYEFSKNNWKYFVNKEINELRNEVTNLEEQLLVTKDKKEKLIIKETLTIKKEELFNLEYRIKNNITYDNSYLNITLNNYVNNLNEIKTYKETKKLTLKEKYEYQNIKESLAINKYILDNKQNYNKQNNLNYQLRTIVDDYEIFIIILILIVASTIVAEEFQNGTIKLLLIKPYSRGKILLSKYFAVIILMMLTILYLILLQIIIGGIIFKFSSLKIPVIAYDFNKECIVEYNVFIYMIIRIITKLPMLVMITTISFCLSESLNNVATSITIPLFIYIFTPSINNLISQYKINIFKYFVSVNWNFNDYLFGKISKIDGLKLSFSIIIWCIYFVSIIIFTYINFKKKNIRNI